MMKILYLGDNTPGRTALHRGDALRRLGHVVEHVNPDAILRNNRWGRILHHRTGYLLATKAVHRHVLQSIGKATFDIAWVDSGHSISAQLVNDLRRRCRAIVNYNLDDPTGSRDGARWWTFRRALSRYDLLAVVRNESVSEYQSRGAKRVIRVFRSYDPVAHAPTTITPELRARWSSKVAFVGTWMPERGPFFCRLLDLGLPIVIMGDRWQKSPEWLRLRPVVRPGPFGAEYVIAIQCAEICLGLVSKGNRDLHTQRSAEIPFIGSVFCAERTSEHKEMYAEDRDAVFWSSADECARQCQKLLADRVWANSVARAGRKRVLELGLSNDAVLDKILKTLSEIPNKASQGDAG